MVNNIKPVFKSIMFICNYSAAYLAPELLEKKSLEEELDSF
jgi:hypothetical protein